MKGPTASLRRISEFRNCDELMPMVLTNSLITPEPMVSLVNGRAMSSNVWAFASSIQRENLELGDCMLLALERYAERTRERLHC